MANQEHLKTLRKGVKAWASWREANPDEQPDLCGADLGHAHLGDADLSGADLSGARVGDADLVSADLSGAFLSGADLSGADLSYADLSGAILSGADLVGADLSHAHLGDADLSGADLIGADLIGADLSHADLSDADLSGARVGATVFGDVDLRNVKGLDTVRHRYPSTSGIDTIYRSGGQIPESFLRAAGVPESFITFMKSLTGAAFDFYSCFISYSTKDQDFADRLYADLQAQHVRCWFAPHDIQGGRKIHEQIDEAIRVYDKLLLILSDASMNSPWVKTEIANARAREVQQKRQMLFPISLAPFERIRDWELFDADTGIDSAREIREYFVPDFSHWKDHDSYTKGFERLLKDLQAEREKSTSADLR